MANEFTLEHDTPGTAIDGWLLDGAQIWNGSAFVDPDQDDQADYALPFSEIPLTENLSLYVLDFPTAITTAKVYALRTTVRENPSDDPALDDERFGYTVAISWDGAREVVGLVNAGVGVRFGSGNGNQVA